MRHVTFLRERLAAVRAAIKSSESEEEWTVEKVDTLIIEKCDFSSLVSLCYGGVDTSKLDTSKPVVTNLVTLGDSAALVRNENDKSLFQNFPMSPISLRYCSSLY